MHSAYFAVEPWPNELFSSWAANTAARTRDTAYATARRLLGSKTAWIRDIDRIVSPEELILAGARAGIAPLLALRTSMWPLIAPEDRGRRGGITQGLMVTGIYHRDRRHSGLQFCPHCLAGDRVPYFRKQWRLALWCMCPIHHILLHSGCYRCAAPLALHRTAGAHICVCHRCGSDHRDTMATLVDSDRLKPLKQLQSMSPSVRFTIDSVVVDYIQALGLLRDLWRLLTTADFRQVLLANHGTHHDGALPEVTQLMELTPSHVRAFWLPRLAALIGKGLPEVISACRSAYVTQSMLRDCRRTRISEVTQTICRHLAKEQKSRRLRVKKAPLRMSNIAALTAIGLDRAVHQNLHLFDTYKRND